MKKSISKLDSAAVIGLLVALSLAETAWAAESPAPALAGTNEEPQVIFIAPAEMRPGVRAPAVPSGGTPAVAPGKTAGVGGPGLPPDALMTPQVSVSAIRMPALSDGPSTMTQSEEAYAAARERMVASQLAGAGRGGFSPKVLAAMSQVPRHQFVLTEFAADSYEDKSLSIGFEHTIETPYLVAAAAEQIHPQPSDRVLEVGTGAGYQAAVLSCLVKEVYTIEPHETLARNAVVNFQRMGYTNNLFVRQVDAAVGWPEAAPFDAIVFNGSPDQITDQVKSQLKSGGRLVVTADDANVLREYQKIGNQLVLAASKNVRPKALTESNRVNLSSALRQELRARP